MDVCLKSTKVLLEHVHLSNWYLFLHTELLSYLKDRFHIFKFVQIRHITSIKNIVDIFELLLFDNLSINEQE